MDIDPRVVPGFCRLKIVTTDILGQQLRLFDHRTPDVVAAEAVAASIAMPIELNEPLMAHRHLSQVAGREITKAAIDDIVTRGTIGTWRKLVQAMNADKTGRMGGTAAAVHAGRRISFDHDHVVKDLAKNYDAAILALESIAGWHIAPVIANNAHEDFSRRV
jgi:hypothetical protein